MADDQYLLHVKDVSVSIGTKKVCNAINFTMSSAKKMAIVGANGAGKTSLLKCIAGLLQPDEGKILLNGKAIKGPHDQLIPGNKGIAYLSQHFELRNNYTVKDLLNLFNKMDDASAQVIYTACDINSLLDRKTHELSGGEKQRICLAITLTEKPALLLLDEPFSNADNLHKESLKKLLDQIIRHLGVAVLVVSHEAADVLSWTEQLLLLHQGNLLQMGAPEKIYYYPHNKLAAGLLGAYNYVQKGTVFWELFLNDIKEGNAVIIRPNQLTINNNADYFMQGTIVDFTFNGLYGLYQIESAEGLYSIATTVNAYKKGQTVRFGPLVNACYRLFNNAT